MDMLKSVMVAYPIFLKSAGLEEGNKTSEPCNNSGCYEIYVDEQNEYYGVMFQFVPRNGQEIFGGGIEILVQKSTYGILKKNLHR